MGVVDADGGADDDYPDDENDTEVNACATLLRS